MKVEVSSTKDSTSTKFYIEDHDEKIYSKKKQDEFTKCASEENERQKITAKTHCQFNVYRKLN